MYRINNTKNESARLRALAPGETLSEHEIKYEKLADGDGRFSVAFRADSQRIHRVAAWNPMALRVRMLKDGCQSR